MKRRNSNGKHSVFAAPALSDMLHCDDRDGSSGKSTNRKTTDLSFVPFPKRKKVITRKSGKNSSRIMGVLYRLDTGELRLQPTEHQHPELVIDPKFAAGAKPGDLVDTRFAKISKDGLKRGIVQKVIAHIDSEKTLPMIAIISHRIPYIFSSAVLEEAQDAKPADIAEREDWRTLPMVTVDPEDAKDHDDAVFAEPDPDPENPGGHIITVAIADVAAYVHPDSEMDKEARNRGNSVYFPGLVIPMLPERICNDLCSLREGEDRPALAVRMIFNEQGYKLRHSFHRIMIRIIAKLDYAQVQKAIDGIADKKTAPIRDQILMPLWEAYQVLKKSRDKRKPLDLELPEKKILLDSQGRIRDVVVPLRLHTHRLIEEFMIAANVAAAETLQNQKKPFIYRIHDRPSHAKQEILREFLYSAGLASVRKGDLTAEKLNTILSGAKETKQYKLVNQAVLRSQHPAEYNPVNIGHFGLQLKNYTHYTSPIRRYADLVVHRALIRVLAGDNKVLPDEEKHLKEISITISAAERRAMAAERETEARLVACYLSDQKGASFEGNISGVTRNGLFITLEHYGADGFVPISTLGHEYYHFHEACYALVGEQSSKGYQLGDTVTICLEKAMPIAGTLRFKMLSPPHHLPFSVQSSYKTSGHQRKKHAAYRKK